MVSVEGCGESRYPMIAVVQKVLQKYVSLVSRSTACSLRFNARRKPLYPSMFHSPLSPWLVKMLSKWVVFISSYLRMVVRDRVGVERGIWKDRDIVDERFRDFERV